MHFTKLVYITFVLVRAVLKLVLVLTILVKFVLMVNGKNSCWFITRTVPFVFVDVFVPEILEILSCRIAG